LSIIYPSKTERVGNELLDWEKFGNESQGSSESSLLVEKGAVEFWEYFTFDTTYYHSSFTQPAPAQSPPLLL
jgi:hypothetical protein